MADETEWWPAERLPVRDTRVIPAIDGARNAVSRRLGMETRLHGLDPAEALVLVTIQRGEGCAPWQIRSRLGLHRSTLGSILDRLERDERLTRGDSPDGRRFDLRLTRAGHTAADLAHYAIESVEDEIAGYTSKAERRGAVAVFEACMAIEHRERGARD